MRVARRQRPAFAAREVMPTGQANLALRLRVTVLRVSLLGAPREHAVGHTQTFAKGRENRGRCLLPDGSMGAGEGSLRLGP